MTVLQKLASNPTSDPSPVERFLHLLSGSDAVPNAQKKSQINVFTNHSQDYSAHTNGYNSRVWTKASPKTISPPSAVAYPTNPEEVATLVRAAGTCGFAVVSRSGGHNYAGFSSGVVSGGKAEKLDVSAGKYPVQNGHSSVAGDGNGVLVIDLSAFNAINFDKEVGDGTEIVTIGAGCRLGRVATILAEQGRALPHGTCPTVAIGGHAAHGGHGLTSRKWGLTLDRIVAHEVVLADGTIATIPVPSSSEGAEPSKTASLSWALRGCGPSFAVITAYKLRTVPAPPITVHFDYWFPAVSAELAAEALMAYQAWLPWLPGELGTAFMYICGEFEDTIEVKLTGQFLGPEQVFTAIVSPFMQTLKRLGLGTPSASKTVECGWLQCLSRMTDDVPLIPDDPRGPTAGEDDMMEGPVWLSDSFYVKSLAILDGEKNLLTKQQASALAKYLVDTDTTHKKAEKLDPNRRKTWWFVMADNWGGADSALSEGPASSTASNTYDNLYAFQMFARPDDRKLPFTEDGVQFVKGMWDAVIDSRPANDGWRYGGIANYVDPEMSREDAQRMYYGDEKVVKLREAKRQWDPKNVFRYPHSILPA